MKLILLHGSLQELVSKKISEIKKDFDTFEIFEDNGNGMSLVSQSLFSEKRLIVLNDPDLNLVEKVILQTDPQLTVILRFSKALEKSSAILKRFVGAKVEIFEYNEQNQKNIFPLLDMIGNLNKSAFVEFEKNYKEFGGQYILVMLAYFLRRMVSKSKSGSGFMLQKIESQKRNFDLKKITHFYKELIETDFKIKRGFIEEREGVTILLQKFLTV